MRCIYRFEKLVIVTLANCHGILVFTTHLVEAEIALDDDRYHLSPSCISIIPTGFSTASLLEEDKNGLFFTFSAEINGFPFYRRYNKMDAIRSMLLFINIYLFV